MLLIYMGEEKTQISIHSLIYLLYINTCIHHQDGIILHSVLL